MTSRKLIDLDEKIRLKVKKFIEACNEKGIEIIITCTYRDNEEQELLWQNGFSRLKGGLSKHNIKKNNIPSALACDIVPVIEGKAVWDNEALWNKIKIIANDCGLDDPISWDKGHFEEIKSI